MLSVFLEKNRCSGCSACYATCPTGAITMQADAEGFKYPVIDAALCIDCGACRTACPFIAEDAFKATDEQHYYVAQNRSPAVLTASTSGGAFTALSDAILAEGGAVYGADFDKNFRVHHTRATIPAGRDRQRVSKYVQSDMGNTFSAVRADLRAGRPVLFTGTPCQCAGLRGFMGDTPTDRLVICDLICHSIPSPLMWEEYKALLEAEAGGRLINLRFRSKDLDWSYINADKTFYYQTSTMAAPRQDGRFYHLYFRARTVMRPSCAVCPFADTRRPSDITIADYWGIEKYDAAWFDPRGVSLVITNTQQGEHLLAASEPYLASEERPAEESLGEQKRLRSPIRFPEAREQFWQVYREKGFRAALDYATQNTLR